MTTHATAEGTAAYRRRFDRLPAGHFRTAWGLQVSSIGLGTYLGDADAVTDEAYRSAIAAVLDSGCNIIDCAINYRFQRSERVIGDAWSAANAAGRLRREEVIIASKAGYLPFDTSPPDDPGQWFHDNLIASGVASFDDLVAGCHCMTPAYLQHQLATSLRNLRVHCVDIYYVHNPETQLSKVSRPVFFTRLRAAFAQLEEAAAAGQIQVYGLATWSGLRQPENARDYLPLAQIVQLAEEAGGANHHFRVVQVPFNLAMPEALVRRNQRIDGERVSLLSAAAHLGVTVIASASLLQGQLSRRLPAEISHAMSALSTDAQRALQFVRSTPGITTALVGMKDRAHVEENLSLARIAPLAPEEFLRTFGADRASA